MIAKGPYFAQYQQMLRDLNAPETDVHVIFVAHGYLWKNGLAYDGLEPIDGIAGIANFGNVCSRDYKSRSFIERGGGKKGDIQTRVLLHEVGHNFGQGHRKNWKKLLGSNLCERTKPDISIMRGYLFETWPETGNPKNRQYVWTQCNRCDLLRNYQKQMIERGSYCLDRS